MINETNSLSPIQGIVFSETNGQGKTVWLVSYYRWGKDVTRRLLLELEWRARTYKSPDKKDHPEELKFAFDYFRDRYAEHMDDTGNITIAGLKALYDDIKNDNFPYDVLLIDGMSALQDRMLDIVRGGSKQTAGQLAKAFGVYQAQRANIEFKFKPTDNTIVYGIIKACLGQFCRMCRVKGIDLLVATERQNKWANFGKPGMKILGRTAKVLEPVFKYADFSYEISRLQGSREKGTAKLTDTPTFTLDKVNPKNSIPGLKPTFKFTWDTFWEMALSTNITSQADLDAAPIEKAEAAEYEMTREDHIKGIKATWLALATERSIMTSKTDSVGLAHLIELLGETYSTINDAVDFEAVQAEGLKKIKAWEAPE